MRLIPLLITVSVIAIISLLFVRFIDLYLLPRTVPETAPINEAEDSDVDSIVVYDDSGPSIPQTEAPVVMPEPAPVDAQSIIERQCSKCHSAKWLEEIEKPRSEWEKVLEKMENMGVHLDETERVILLNYLAGADLTSNP